jgi:hypothetical protein
MKAWRASHVIQLFFIPKIIIKPIDGVTAYEMMLPDDDLQGFS